MNRSNFQSIALTLDRPGARWLLAWGLPLAAARARDGVRRLSYDRGWVHRFDRLTSVEPSPRLRGYHLEAGEAQAAWGLIYTPKPGDTVIDVGAGLGAESVYYADQVGPSGRVVAIEAQPYVFGFLKRTLDLNGFHHATALNVAAADAPGTVMIEDDHDHHLGNSIGGTSGVPVPARRLDDIADELGLGRVDFLKMNIEGAERLAIQGMDRLWTRTAVLSISCHDFKFARTGNAFFRTKAEVETVVRDRGFTIVPRKSERAEFADQVNAYNPDLRSL